MPLSVTQHLALWGPPILMLLITVGYYVRWGKEPDERPSQQSDSSMEGGH